MKIAFMSKIKRREAGEGERKKRGRGKSRG